MRKFLVFGLLFLFFAQPISADKKLSRPSLSDAVYADLAIRNYLDNVSIYYTDVKSTHNIKLNETRHWIPASTVKTFAAMYAYKLIAERKLNPYKNIVIDAKNSVPTEFVIDELPTPLEGDSVTLGRLIRQMITQSDNTAFNVLLDILGRDNITNYIQSLDLTHSRVGSKLNLDTSQEQYEFDVPGYGINTTTAEDYAKAFILIQKNKIPGAKDLFAMLKDQKINNMIPLLLPKDVVCAHKTGDLDPLYHDGGTCQGKKDSYVLTIFTNAGDPNVVAHLSELIYTKNFDLIGADLKKQPISENIREEHQLDSLVMNPPRSPVLGITTANNFPVPNITAADLGITAKDLSLVIKDKDLPKVIIPADSPLHIFSDAFQIVKKAVVLDPKVRRNVDLELAKLRLAEAKDLARRGKTQEARIVLQSIQQRLTIMTKNTTIAHDSSAQNTIQAISETRFSIFADELKKTKGEEKLALIKDIANQAKDTLQNIQPKIPDATNATNPSQKPLIGEIINTTPTEVTIKTSGGQQVTIPINNNPVVIKDKKTIPANSPAASVIQENPPTSPNPSAIPSLSSLAIGTTVALLGSTTNNTFSPTLILTNIPRELSAPQPVTVAKVDTKHNTMIIIENGIYTQVNIDKNTSIKGADTNIHLREINPGDVVIVHGEPLTPISPTKTIPFPTRIPTVSVVPGVKNSLTPPPETHTTINTAPKSLSNTLPSKPPVNSSSPVPSSVKTLTTSTPQNQTVQAYPTVSPRQTVSTQTQSTQPQPKVIQGQSIHFIEKKEDTTKVPSSIPPQPKSEQKTHEAPHEQPKSQPQALPFSQPTINKNDEKKK